VTLSLRACLLLCSVFFGGAACGSPASDPGAGGESQAGTGSGGGGTGGQATGGAGQSTSGTGGSAGGSSGGQSGSTGAGTGGTDAGTGGTGAVPALPDVDPGKNIRELTPEEKGELCDWVANLFGGYGTSAECPDGSRVRNFSDQAQCIESGFMFACMGVTVGDVERCSIARIPSMQCETPDEGCRELYCQQ